MSAAAKKSPGFIKHPGYMVHAENSPRQVRVEFGGEVIAISANTVLLRESHHVPVYYFPRENVRMDLLTRTDQSTFCPFKGDASYWSVEVGGQKAGDAVWSYETPFEEACVIKEYVAFYWNKMDRWFEEDEEIFVHPRDPYKRVDAIKSRRSVKIILGGEVIAESSNATCVFETGLPTRYYLPMDDIRMEMLKPSDTTTHCPYKGQAIYWSVTAGGKVFDDIVWSYPQPLEEVSKLKSLLCFYGENVDVLYIDNEAEHTFEIKGSKYLKETLEGPEHIV